MNGFKPPWFPGDTPEEKVLRQQAYERLAAAARRVGLSVEKLHDLLGKVAQNETETRRFLSEDVYHVRDDLLDDLLRIKLKDLDR